MRSEEGIDGFVKDERDEERHAEDELVELHGDGGAC